jgi:tetratricopeptide (TPR) repeat protein
MNKLWSGLLVTSVVLSALTIFGSGWQSIAAANALPGPIRQDAPLTLTKFEQMLEHGTPDPTIAALIRRNGVAFRPTAEMLARLGRINYPQTLHALEALRRPTPTPKPNNAGKEDRTKGAAKRPKEPRAATAPNTITILVANFDGVDQQRYRVTDKIIQGLVIATQEYSDISIQPLGETITTQTGSKGGSAYARDLGTKRKANIVLWGFYGATSEQVDVSVYFEVLRPQRGLILRQNLETQTSRIADLDGFKIQTRLTKEMTYLVLLTVGLARYESGDYEGAISRFTKALAQSNAPDQIIDPVDIYFYRGSAYYFKAKAGANVLDHAIADLDEAIKLKPDLYEAYYNRGLAYAGGEQYDLMIADFSKAIELKPNSSKAYYNRGLTYSKKGQHDLAAADYSKAIELKPDDPEAYNNRGNEYTKTKQYGLAIVDYTKAIKIKSDLVMAYHNRGLTYAVTEQYDLALADFSKVIKLKPDDPSAYYYRAAVYHYKGEQARAIADLRNVLRVTNDPKLRKDAEELLREIGVK